MDFSKGVVLPCRTYIYLAHQTAKAWGISQNIVASAPFLPLIAPKLVVDEYAFDAENLAYKNLGWVSGEIHTFLRDNHALETFNFQDPIRKAAVNAPQAVAFYKQELQKAISRPNLYDILTEMDTQLHGPATPIFSPGAAAFLDGMAPAPIWLEREYVIRDIFIGSDFQLLPRQDQLDERDQKKFADASALVSAAQRKWAIKLALGEVDYKEYQKAIHDEKVDEKRTEYEVDQEIDDLLRSFRDVKFKGMNYMEKLNELMAARESFLPDFLKLVSDSRLDDKRFLDELRRLVNSKARGILF